MRQNYSKRNAGYRGDKSSYEGENYFMLLRSGLSCFQSKTLLAKALEMALSDHVIMMIMTVIMTMIIIM